MHARVAADNHASRRVLEKCGFRVIATERGFAGARAAEIEELVLRLDAPALPSK
jgi:RimJ/RimL family protein N-acetyltransferase